MNTIELNPNTGYLKIAVAIALFLSLHCLFWTQSLFLFIILIILIIPSLFSVDTVAHFCKHGYLPHPHFIIGDHGTHVVDGVDFQPVDSLQNPIIQKWNCGNQLLKELLQNEVGIQLQPLDPPYRVAYYYNPNDLQDQTVQKITDAGYDVIQSCDMYLDIVPQGVNKGSSLLKLLDYLNINHEIVVTCGDSLNDLSLFQTGLKSVVVGNSEPKLVKATKELSNVYHSVHPGLWGVIDGLCFYDKVSLFNLSL